MNPGAEAGGSHAVDVLGTLASGLGVDSRESGRRALEVVRARSPELIALGERTGEDLVTTSAGFIEMMLAALRTDIEPPWAEYYHRSRDYGRLHRHARRVSACHHRAAVAPDPGQAALRRDHRSRPEPDRGCHRAAHRCDRPRLPRLRRRGAPRPRKRDVRTGDDRHRNEPLAGPARNRGGRSRRVARCPPSQYGRSVAPGAIVIQAGAHGRSRPGSDRRLRAPGGAARKSRGLCRREGGISS